MGRFGSEDLLGCFIGSRDLEMVPAIRDGLDRDRTRTGQGHSWMTRVIGHYGECCQWDDMKT